MVSLPFRNRDDAARQLIAPLEKYHGLDPLILAIPRGAVPMGRILAEALDGELDVVLVRKLGAPGNSEFAIGAVDEQGNVMLGEHVAKAGADEDYVHREAQRQGALIRERRARYRPGQDPIAPAGRIVIVLDDGLATGSTMIAALKASRAQQPAKLVCAVPVAAAESLAQVAKFADEVVCLATPRPFFAVGPYYDDFAGVTDEAVIGILAEPVRSAAHAGLESAMSIESVQIHSGAAVLEGELTIPSLPRGLVIFAHGSGSSRRSPRNRMVAGILNRSGFGTLLFDLLTTREDQDPAKRFEIPLLARRLDAALDWTSTHTTARDLSVGLFGASTGAAAAIMVASECPGEINAVVSRGGRADIAGEQVLSQVRTHTLLIVGAADRQVLELNRSAGSAMGHWAELSIVPDATHLFEEAGALELVATLAADWFLRWLPGHPRGPAGVSASFQRL